jgi:ribonuclease BN (tRNA processing enzyme)
MVGVPAHDALNRLTGAPLFALPLDRYPCPTEVVEVASDVPLRIGAFSVRLIRQRHSGGSVGFRVDDCFAYVTDTDADERHVSFLSGVDVAFMDAFYDTAEYRASGGTSTDKLDHGSNASVAAVAKEAGVRALGLIHINPSYTDERCSAMLEASRTIFPHTIMPEDGVPIHP